MYRNILRRGAASALLLSALAAGAAHAEYPERPVTVVVSFAPAA